MKSKYNLKDKTDLSGRSNCPCCGTLNAYVRYEHKKTSTLLPAHVGRCIMPKCAHSYTVRQFFEDKEGVYNQRSFYTDGNSY